MNPVLPSATRLSPGGNVDHNQTEQSVQSNPRSRPLDKEIFPTSDMSLKYQNFDI